MRCQSLRLEAEAKTDTYDRKLMYLYLYVDFPLMPSDRVY